MKLVEKKTGAIVDVPDAQAQAAFLSGAYGVPKGAPMPVKNVGMGAGVVDPADAARALGDGARVATEGEFRDAQDEARYGGVGGTAIAAGIGAARGAAGAFGVPLDAVATGLADMGDAQSVFSGHHEIDPYRGERDVSAGDALREKLSGYQRANAGASALGELGGMAGAALLGGGALGRIGAGAEALAGRGLAGGVARAGAEGAALGGIGAINESALGDTQLTASKVLAGVGHGALVGGLLGGGLHLGAEAAAGIRDRAGRFLGALRAPDIESLAQNHFGFVPEGLGAKVKTAVDELTPGGSTAERIQQGYTKLAAGSSGKDAETINRFTALTPEGAEARRIAVYDAPKIQEEAERAVRKHVDDLMNAGDLVSAEARGELKADYVRKAIGGDEAAHITATRQHLDQLEAGLNEQLSQEMAPSMVKSARTVRKLIERARQVVGSDMAAGVDPAAAMRATGARVLGDIEPTAAKVFGSTPEGAWNTLTHAPDGYGFKFDRFVEDGGKIEAYGLAHTKAGGYAGEFGSTFSREDGKLIAKTDNLLMGPEHQGKGVGSAIARNLEDTYRKLGVNEIRLDASQTGRYTWAKAGYEWAPSTGREMENDFRSWLVKHGHDPAEAGAALRGAQAVADSPNGKAFLLSDDAPNWSATKQLNPVTAEAKGGADAFIALDSLKRGVQRLTATGYRSLRMIADPVDQLNARRTVSWLDGAASDLRAGLEDGGLWGKAADDQRAINAAWTKQIDASKRFHRSLTTEVGRDPNNPYVEMRGADPQKVSTYVKNLTNPYNDLTHKAVKDFVTGSRDLSEAISKSYDLPADKLAEVARVKDAASSFESTIGKAEKSLVTANQYRALLEGPEGPTIGSALGTIGSVVGGLPGGVLGSALGAAMGAVNQPAKVIAQMAAIEKIASSVDNEIATGVKSFLSGGKSSSALPDSVAFLSGGKGRGVIGEREAFEKKVTEITRLAGAPAQVVGNVSKFTDQFADSAPNLATALTAAALKGVQYLAQTAPPGFQKRPEALAWGIDEKPLYTDAEMREWARRAAVVNDPMAAVRSMKKKMLTPEEADALKNVHAPVFEQLQREFQKQRTDKPGSMNYGQQLQVELMFGVPLNRTLDRAFMTTVQSSFKVAEAKPRPPSPKSMTQFTRSHSSTADSLRGGY